MKNQDQHLLSSQPIRKSTHSSQNSSSNFPKIQFHSSITNQQLCQLIESRPSPQSKQIHFKPSSNSKFNSQFLTLIIYNYLQTPKLQEFLQISLQQIKGQLCLVKKPLGLKKDKETIIKKFNNDEKEYLKTVKQYEYFLLYMVNQNMPLELENYHHQQKERPKSTYSANQQDVKELKPMLITLIALCDKVIVYELDNEKQAFVQMIFFQSINTFQKIKWQNPHTRVHRLVFIRQCYQQKNLHNTQAKQQPQQKTHPKPTNKKHQRPKHQQFQSKKLQLSTSMQTLKYFSSLQQYSQHTQTQKQRYLSLTEQYNLANQNNFIQQLIKRKKVIKKITLQQIVQIYYNIGALMNKPIQQVVVETTMNQYIDKKMLSKENKSSDYINLLFNETKQGGGGSKINVNQPWKLRYYLQRIYELISLQNLYSTIEQQIFYPNTQNHSIQLIYKQIQKYLHLHPQQKLNDLLINQISLIQYDYIPQFINQLSLSINSKQKLLWKLYRLKKYEHQVHQQSKLSPNQSSNKIISELTDQQLVYWLQKHYKRWLQQSMQHLKQYFNKIANQKDHKAIQQFKQQCYRLQQRLKKFAQKQKQTLPSRKQKILSYIKSELQNFIEYHVDILQKKRFSRINYFVKQIPFLIKHNQKIRNKMIIFGLIMILMLMQKNLIAAMILGTLGIIVLAIRL